MTKFNSTEEVAVHLATALRSLRGYISCIDYSDMLCLKDEIGAGVIVNHVHLGKDINSSTSIVTFLGAKYFDDALVKFGYSEKYVWICVKSPDTTLIIGAARSEFDVLNPTLLWTLDSDPPTDWL